MQLNNLPTSPFMPIVHDGIKTVPVAQQKAQIKQQVEQFATVLYAEMFQDMREAGKAQGDDDDEGSDFGKGDTDMFMHFMDESMGKNFIKQGGNGLADALYKQLAGRLDAQQGGGK